MRKRLLAIIATVAMVVAMMPSMVFGATVEVDNATDFKENLKAGKSVKLTGSFELNESVDVNGDVTIDLNGETITGKDNNIDTGDSSGNFNLIVLSNGDSLVINDSKGNGAITLEAVNNRAWNSMSNVIENHGGTVTINGGQLTHKGGTDMAYVVNVNANYADDPVLNVYGGELSSTYTAIRCYMWEGESTCYVNIYGGSVKGDTSALWAQAPDSSASQTAVINVKGGTMTGPAGGNAITTARSGFAVVNTTISGGTINGNITAEKGELHISGGTVNGELVIREADNQTQVTSGDFITGGTFSSDVSDYLADSVKQDAEGNVVCIEHNSASITSEVTVPTCTEDGYTTYTCGDCNYSWKDDVVKATGVHTYKDGVCTVCGEKAPAPAAKPEKSPETGDNSVAPFAVAGLILAAMAAAAVARRRYN